MALGGGARGWRVAPWASAGGVAAAGLWWCRTRWIRLDLAPAARRVAGAACGLDHGRPPLPWPAAGRVGGVVAGPPVMVAQVRWRRPPPASAPLPDDRGGGADGSKRWAWPFGRRVGDEHGSRLEDGDLHVLWSPTPTRLTGDLVWLVWWLVGVGYGWGKPLACCDSHDASGAPSPLYFLESASSPRPCPPPLVPGESPNPLGLGGDGALASRSS